MIKWVQPFNSNQKSWNMSGSIPFPDNEATHHWSQMYSPISKFNRQNCIYLFISKTMRSYYLQMTRIQSISGNDQGGSHHPKTHHKFHCDQAVKQVMNWTTILHMKQLTRKRLKNWAESTCTKNSCIVSMAMKHYISYQQHKIKGFKRLNPQMQ